MMSDKNAIKEKDICYIYIYIYFVFKIINEFLRATI
jgi:hypothetical protein